MPRTIAGPKYLVPVRDACLTNRMLKPALRATVAVANLGSCHDRSEMDSRWIARPAAPHDFGRVVAEIAEHHDGGVAPRATGD